ncbi:MAG: hypothetical protein U9R74_20210 [Pseudomonadota bacterium]|nr:hypothetical protein [Pseudomonadota bacterium]
MKALLRVAIPGLVAAMLAAPVWAEDLSEETKLTAEIIEAKKKLIVLQNMNLTEAETAKFLPVYEKYQERLSAINEKSAELIKDFAEHYEHMTNERARNLLNDYLDIEAEKNRLQKYYVKKFNEVLSAKNVARYYQVENKIDAIIDYQLVEVIPLVQ